MKISRRAACLLFALALPALAGCGYSFPHVMDGPERVIYMADWPNRTNKLGLDNRIYQSVAGWFQKSDAIRLTKTRTGADYILGGEIMFIHLPSVSWDGVARSKSINVVLVVRYALQDAKTGRIVWEVGGKAYSSDYAEERVSAEGDEMALAEIIDDLAEDVYMGVMRRIRLHNEAKLELDEKTSFENPEAQASGDGDSSEE